MKIILLMTLLFCSLLVNGFISEDKEDVIVQNNAGTMAKVYVNYPNFEVIDEQNSRLMTIVKEASVPSKYSGTLIKLKTDNLNDVKMVLKNLEIEKVLMFKEDLEIANKIIDAGFNVKVG